MRFVWLKPAGQVPDIVKEDGLHILLLAVKIGPAEKNSRSISIPDDFAAHAEAGMAASIGTVKITESMRHRRFLSTSQDSVVNN